MRLDEVEATLKAAEPEPVMPEQSVVGKTIAAATYSDPGGWVPTDMTVVFTDGTVWRIGTCTCCGLSDSTEKESDDGQA